MQLVTTEEELATVRYQMCYWRQVFTAATEKESKKKLKQEIKKKKKSKKGRRGKWDTDKWEEDEVAGPCVHRADGGVGQGEERRRKVTEKGTGGGGRNKGFVDEREKG